ncbi:hypothetical protein VP1G_10396 [Cytospora mali]|uniref:Uncharacterized protein n=1 Tax=Cytospora mali TaxID=578113 RepID=A0A194VGW1_CYTMA|nr:hypothetical protein VP1G_10396 [Valsa mali var. pyri (nom. inval.)]
MSSRIDIPSNAMRQSSSSQSPLSSSSSTYSTSPSTPARSSTSAQKQKMVHERRPSLLGSAISKSESTVINIGEPDGPPRLISYLSSSQGFAWNPELFLPSYVDYDYTPLENKREPVIEITLTDEEIANMFPRN